jgi:uncharacterized membrane protein YjjP (DUF1212 family)
VASSPDQESQAASAALDEAAELLQWLGASMLRAGNPAVRTREWLEVMARKLGFDAISVSLSLDSITVRARRDGQWVMAMREIGPPGINAWRIGELEQLARTAGPGVAPREIAAKIAEIESTPPRHSAAPIAAAIGLASGGFAFLNGAGPAEMIAAGIGGTIGQGSRAWLSGRRLNQYGVATLTAVAASGAYVLAVALAAHIGLGVLRHPAGFISSVLFLVPGFPLIAALFDLLQYQTVAAISRLVYGVMILLAVAFGLSIVIAVAKVDLSPQPVLELAYPLKLLLRAVASFAAGYAFAMLFNNSARTAFAVALSAMIANELRLVLLDTGMMLAPAAFFGALTVGLVALWAGQRFDVPRIAMTVPAIVIMIPGIYAFEMIVLFNRGQMLEALQASAACGFVIGALAMGLAVARFFQPVAAHNDHSASGRTAVTGRPRGGG